MKLFISVDMEGTTGLERLEEIFRGLPGFDTFRQLMAGDCNAVIQGAIDGGATEIVVSDSHGYMCNMRPDDLIRGVQLRRGQLKRQWCQMKTLDGSFDAAILIGYHAKAGTTDGILAHTWITGFRDVRVNGQSVPEPSLNTWLAGAFGVPVVMLSGDDYVIEQSRPVLGDDRIRPAQEIDRLLQRRPSAGRPHPTAAARGRQAGGGQRSQHRAGPVRAAGHDRGRPVARSGERSGARRPARRQCALH